ncbi:MAG: YdcF family protein [Acidimicrobiales bacterium]
MEDGPAEPEARTPRPRRRRLVLRLLGAAFLLGVVYVGVTFVMVYRASRHDGARAADAVIVLGAAQYNGRPSLVLQDRLDHALTLYEAGLAPRIVVTGGRQAGDVFTEATTGYNYLRAHGVPDEALLKEVGGRNTYESLAASARFLRDLELTDVVLVTDGYHALRVRSIAEDLGLRAAVSPTDTRLSRAGELRQLLRETAAVSVGRIIGWNRLFRLDAAVND